MEGGRGILEWECEDEGGEHETGVNERDRGEYEDGCDPDGIGNHWKQMRHEIEN